MMALPAKAAPLASDASTTRKFYTLTASLRETYDDNVSTTSSGSKQASLETELSPSILVDFPMEDSDFSARYTFGITYYSAGPNYGGGGNGPSIEYTDEFVAQYAHAFSDRFNLNLAEQFRYYVEPSILASTGTNYQNGAYVSNALNGTVTAQWTPLFGTTTTYANTIVKYDQTAVALNQNSIENTGTQTFSLSILPKIGVSLGGIGDNITYDTALRGYTNYTVFTGGQWQALPSLSMIVRGGGSYIEPMGGKAVIAPYGALSFSWTLGERSALSFDYAHEVTPTGQIGANGQTSDRFSSNFSYNITTSLSSHLQGIFTNAVISQNLAIPGAGTSSTQYDYELDTGLTYRYDRYLDFDFGVILSGVTTEAGGGNGVSPYTRDEAYLGVRGTY